MYNALAAAVTVDFSGIKLPFGVGDMLTTATSFLGIFGDWGLLAAAVIFVPALVGLVFWFLGKAKKGTPGAKA